MNDPVKARRRPVSGIQAFEYSWRQQIQVTKSLPSTHSSLVTVIVTGIRSGRAYCTYGTRSGSTSLGVALPILVSESSGVRRVS